MTFTKNVLIITFLVFCAQLRFQNNWEKKTPVGRSYIFDEQSWMKVSDGQDVNHNWDSFRKNPSWPLWSVDHHRLNKYKWSRRGVVVAFFHLFYSPCQQIPINCSSVPLVSVQCAEQLKHRESTRSYPVYHTHTDNSENINSQLNPVSLTRKLNTSKHSGGNTLLDVTTVVILLQIPLDKCYITLLLLAVTPNTGGGVMSNYTATDQDISVKNTLSWWCNRGNIRDTSSGDHESLWEIPWQFIQLRRYFSLDQTAGLTLPSWEPRHWLIIADFPWWG